MYYYLNLVKRFLIDYIDKVKIFIESLNDY